MDVPLTFHYITFALIVMSAYLENDVEFPFMSNDNYVEDEPCNWLKQSFNAFV